MSNKRQKTNPKRHKRNCENRPLWALKAQITPVKIPGTKSAKQFS